MLILLSKNEVGGGGSKRFMPELVNISYKCLRQLSDHYSSVTSKMNSCPSAT
jgi:hypothetical protein